MAKTVKVSYYLGTIVATGRENSELGKPELHVIEADIPGVAEKVVAYPIGSGIDEPRVGDPVLLRELDPVYKSYYTYEILKETEFIGFRASGKEVSITPNSIVIGVYDQGDGYSGGTAPDPSKASITIGDDNNIVIKGTGDLSITVDGNCNISASGDCNISASGTLNTDGGTWKTSNGTASPTGNGPFCGISVCPFTGAPHSGQQC